MQDLTIAYLQFNVQWHDWEANVVIIKRHLEKLQESIDLLILPEAFSSGFTMSPGKIAQHMDGPVVNWMIQTAKSRNCTVIGSVMITDEGALFNRMICAYPNGEISHYDKRHLFTFAGEDKEFTAGNHRLQFNIRDWTICPFICYDLRFPVWSRNNDNYDVLVYSASWPSARIGAWHALLRARAIENQAYTIGVNRTGHDNNDFQYSGASEVFDMAGDSLQLSGAEDHMNVVVLSKSKLNTYRSKYNFLVDMDRYIIE